MHWAMEGRRSTLDGAASERKNPGGLSNNSVGATLTKTNEQVWDWGRKRQTETDVGRNRDRGADRQTEMKTDRQRGREIDRQTYRQ